MSEHTPTGSKPRSAMSNAGWNAFSTVWNIAISFALAPVLILHLGTDQYGILLLIWSVTGILGVMNFGMGEATLRYVAHYFAERNLAGVNRVMGATLTFYLVVCVVASLALFAGAPILAAHFKIPVEQQTLVGWLFRCTALLFSMGIVIRAYNAIPMALQRYDISTRINVVQSVVRSGGYVVLAVLKFELLHLVLWDLTTQVVVLCVQGVVVRKLAPGVRLLPSLSFKGLREIFGFSAFSFLTYVFHMLQRESAKMILGSQLGTAPIAYLGTPDNMSQRLHMVVASGSETLMPRFSANRDPKAARSMFLNGTWASLVVSLIFLLPLAMLMPDFLRLWISPEFAVSSAALGQLVALSYITQGAYAPAAAFFRGTGRPWLVTVVIFLAGCATLLASLLLIPKYGVIGVGYAYLIGSVPALLGVVHGWVHMFGRASLGGLMRVLVLPGVLGGVVYIIGHTVRGYFGELTWVGLFALGGSFAALTGTLAFGGDWMLGGDDAPSKQFLEKIGKSNKVLFLLRRLPFKCLRPVEPPPS